MQVYGDAPLTLKKGGGGSILEGHNVFNGSNLTLSPPLGVGRPLTGRQVIGMVKKIGKQEFMPLKNRKKIGIHH